MRKRCADSAEKKTRKKSQGKNESYRSVCRGSCVGTELELKEKTKKKSRAEEPADLHYIGTEMKKRRKVEEDAPHLSSCRSGRVSVPK